MPIDHVALHVPKAHLDEMITFLVESLKPLGFKEHFRPFDWLIALGEEKPYFWLSGTDELEGKAAEKTRLERPHIAFVATTLDQVKEFHEAGIKAGGTDNGGPGVRPHFGPDYYAAFVKDPVCGINFEVVCRGVKENEG